MLHSILIIDDDQSLSALFKEGLEFKGYKVAVANDGLQGISQACENRPDLILLDFHMPGGGGSTVYECLRELRVTAEIPIIFVTAVPFEEVKASVPIGAHTFFLPKPVSLDKIVALIRKVLGENPQA